MGVFVSDYLLEAFGVIFLSILIGLLFCFLLYLILGFIDWIKEVDSLIERVKELEEKLENGVLNDVI